MNTRPRLPYRTLAAFGLAAMLLAATGCGARFDRSGLDGPVTDGTGDVEEVQSAYICDHYTIQNGQIVCAYWHPSLSPNGARYCYGTNSQGIPYTCDNGSIVLGHPGIGGDSCGTMLYNSLYTYHMNPGEMAIWTSTNYGGDCEILPAGQYMNFAQWQIRSFEVAQHAGALLFLAPNLNNLCFNVNPGDRYPNVQNNFCGGLYGIQSIQSYIVQ